MADLSHAQKAHRDQEFHLRQLEQRMTAIPALEERAKALEAKLTEHDKTSGESTSQLTDAHARIAALGEQVHQLQIELAASQAKLEAQQAIGAELRTYLAQTQPSQPSEQEKAG